VFGLRTLFIVFTLVSLVCGTGIYRGNQQRLAVEKFRDIGFDVYYDYHFSPDQHGENFQEYDQPLEIANPRIPRFLEDYVGVDFFHSVVAIKLPKMRKLKFQDKPIPFEGLPCLKRIDWLGGDDLTLIANATQIRELYVQGFYDVDERVKDLSPLSNLVRLEHLSLHGTDANDLKPLSKMRRLKYLSLEFSEIDSFEGMESLYSLESIRCLGCVVDNLKPLRNLKHLKKLTFDVEENAMGLIKELDGLEGLVGLEELDVRTEGSVIPDLSQSKKLKKFNVHGPGVSDLSPFQGCESLEVLSVNGTEDLTQLNALANLPLKSLRLSSASISNLEPLKDLPLETLSLYMCNVKSLDGIEKLKQIRNLDISGNQIEDFTPLSQLPNLTNLSYWGYREDEPSESIQRQIEELKAVNPNLNPH